jgi:DNA-binding NarL/FixJ family response regulator
VTATEGPEEQAQPSESAPIKVLIVDDHQMFAQSLVSALSREADLQVIGTAGTVEEARARARSMRPDVVLIDYGLPDGDGATAAQHIKDDRPQTKTVMLTSFTDDSVLVAAIEAGCSGHVLKHKGVQELVDAVKAAHAGEALISPAMLARLLPKLHRNHRGVGAELTPREIEVLKLLAEGLSNQAIAQRLTISLHTVRNHVQNIITKLQVHSKLEAVAAAVREGIIKYP